MAWTSNRLVAVIAGGIWALWGAAALFTPAGGLFLGLISQNLWQNVVHLVVGGALIATAFAGAAAARIGNRIVGTFALLLGLAGLFMVGSDANLLELDATVNALHFATSCVLLAVGLGAADRDAAR